jgi:tetratricopeptide (TPR) repeat protein
MNKMKLTATAFFVACILSVIAQNNNLVNAWNYNRSKELDKAKAAIDLAAQHEDTRNSPKMWLRRAQVYQSISETKDEKYKHLDSTAAEKALTSAMNSIKTDKDKTYYDEAKGILAQAAVTVYNKLATSSREKQYEKCVLYTNLLFEVFPLDKDSVIKRSGITPNNLNYQMFTVSYAANNFTAAKEYLQKLIDAKYNDVNIYIYIINLYEKDGNTEKTLTYIEQGRALFPKDPNLIAAELNYYLKQNKSDILLEKVTKAIEITPNNELLYFTQGTIYQGKRDKEQDPALKEKYLAQAEAAYKKSLELKPDSNDANYNLGKLYLDKGIEYNNTANNLPPKETKKIKDLADNAKVEFSKSIPFLERAHQQDPKDGNVTKALLQLYVTTGENDKYAKLKEETKNKK